MKSVSNSKFHTDIKGLIKDLSGPDYITDFYSDIGINSLIILSTVFRADKSYLGTYLAKFLKINKDIYKN